MNLDCPELIADFHKRNNAKSVKRTNDNAHSESHSSTPTNHSTNNGNKRTVRDSVEQEHHDNIESNKKSKRSNESGYARGLEIEKILGATDVYGELMFL